MSNLRSTSTAASTLAALSLAASVLLTGCGIGSAGSTASSSPVASAKTGFGGIVHGGQQPVVGAEVVLWAAGTTGTYGTGATQVAKTTTAGDGSFTFDVAGVSPCTTGQYLYITATGGNAGGGTNNNLGMMTALPAPCSAAAGATNVWIDEVSTVASVTALQQFITTNTYTPPYTGTGTAPLTIGAPSTNVIGLANAFQQVGNLFSLASGNTGASTTTNTVNSVTYTTTITPDTQKINGLADILAVCINDTTGNLCTGSSGVLTLTAITTGSTNAVPKDTIQAAYNMASLPNPQLNSTSGTNKYWTNSTSSTTYLSTLWADITPTAPYPSYTPTTPSDTTISVKWQTSNGTVTAGTIIPASIAIDATGNTWIGAGSGASTSWITEFNAAGQVINSVSTAPIGTYTLSYYADVATPTQASTSTVATSSYTLGYSRPFGLAIDTNNNVWFDAYGATSPGTVAGLLAGITVEVTPTGTVTGYLTGSSPGAMAIDGSNNVFMDNTPTASHFYFGELANTIPGSASPSTAYQAEFEGIGRGTAIFNGVAMDSNGFAWGFGSGTTCTNSAVQRVNNAAMETGESASTTDVTLPSQCAYYGAGDASGNMWASGSYGGTAGSLMYINITCATCTPAAPVVSGTTAGAGLANGGLAGAANLAIDGNGNLWVANNVSSGTGGISEFAVSVNSTTGTATFTPLSPAGSTSAIYGFGSVSNYPHPEGTVIDLSGNLWIETGGGSPVNYLVGVAAPVVTPLATAVSTSKIGVRP